MKSKNYNFITKILDVILVKRADLFGSIKLERNFFNSFRFLLNEGE